MNSMHFVAELNGIYRTKLNIGGMSYVVRISMPAILKINNETGRDLKLVFAHEAVQEVLLQFKKTCTIENLDYLWICERESESIIMEYSRVLSVK